TQSPSLIPYTTLFRSKSETMFANRVYELQAMGNLILSNYSLGINNLFPNIFIIDSSEEISDIMNNVTDKELYIHQMEGVRTVMRSEEHTSELQSRFDL